MSPRSPRRRPRLAAAAILLATGAVLSLPGLAFGKSGAVLVTEVKAVITPVVADHLRDAVEAAERGEFAALVVELDTPGGLDTSMREIVQSFLGSRVPVIVFVAPAGARAASAGAIITMAAHVAVMSPGTAIGAATPVDLQGGDISDKIINDFAAYAASIAKLRERNEAFAVDAVREGRSVPAVEAADIGVVDFLADGLPAVLRGADGRELSLAGGRTVTLATAQADVERFDIGAFRRVQQWLADPNIAFLFLSIGTLGILYELGSPGMGGAGIVGAIMILLALFSLSVLPVNAVGGILMVLAAALFLAEVFTPGVGVFAAGGTAALLLGGIFLFRGSVGVDLAFLIPLAGTAGLTTIVIGRIAWRTRRLTPRIGGDMIIGSRAVVRSAAGSRGRAFVEGAWWNVRSPSELVPGQIVRVVGIENLELLVHPEAEREEETS